MELFVFVVLLVLIVAVVGAGNAGNAYTAVAAPTAIGKASGCGAFLLGLFIIGLVILWLFASLGGGVVGPVEVRPDTAPSGIPQTASDYQPCTRAEHGKLTGDGRWLCIEDGRNPGSFRWRPWPER
jgi:hypothetical protein